MIGQLIDAVANLEEEKTLQMIEALLQADTEPMEIIHACQQGVSIVGERYSLGTYYLSDLIMASEILNSASELLQPFISTGESVGSGTKVIIGTIHGDIHDIGKNIMMFFLKAAVFQIFDLGVNVPQEKFLEAIEETGAKIVGVSVLLSYCFNEIKKLNELLIEAGLRDQVKLIVGGYPVNQAFMEYVGADFYANDAKAAIKIFKDLAN